jgi:hypothetical protein
MHLIKLGHCVVNLTYLVVAEDGALEDEPRTIPIDTVRITIVPGRVMDISGDDAARLRRYLRDHVTYKDEDEDVGAREITNLPRGAGRSPRKR